MFTIDFQPIQNKREEKVAIQSYRYIKRERKYKKNVQIKAGNCFTVAIFFFQLSSCSGVIQSLLIREGLGQRTLHL